MDTQLIDRLTDKQCEALDLVCARFSSKQIAKRLEVSPRSIDQRLDAARRTLGATDRFEAARIYAAAKDIPYRLTSEPFTVTPEEQPEAETRHELGGEHLFSDAITFAEQAPWEDFSARRVPEIKPRDLKVATRAMFIVVMMAALALAAGALVGVYVLLQALLA